MTSDRLSAPAVCKCGFNTMSASEAANHLKECKLMIDFEIELEDGKYKVIFRVNGELECLRYGEKWRDLCGDKMVLALCYMINDLQAKVDHLEGEAQSHFVHSTKLEKEKKELKETIDRVETIHESFDAVTSTAQEQLIAELEEEVEKLKKESEGRF